MKIAIVVKFLDGYVIVNSDGSPMRRSSRVYGDQAEAQRAADRINRARARYDKLGDVTINYDDIYYGKDDETGFITRAEVPSTSDVNESGNPKGRGFREIFMGRWDENISLRDIRNEYGNDSNVMAFLKSAVVSYPDATVRKAISQYFFISSLTEE